MFGRIRCIPWVLLLVAMTEAQGPRVDLWWPKDVREKTRIVTAGLFFPRGTFVPGRHAVVLAGRGGGPCQSTALVMHPDGSVARAAVSFPCSPRPGHRQRLRFRVVSAPEKALGGRGLDAKEKDGSLRVLADEYRFAVDVEEGLPCGRFEGRSGSPPFRLTMTLEGKGSAIPPRVSFEETGPLRAVILCRGRFRPAGAALDIDYVQRWSLTASLAEVTVETWFPAAARIDPGVPLLFRIRSASPLRGLAFGGARARVSPFRLPLRLEADSRLGLALRPDFEGAPRREDLVPAMAWRTRAGSFCLAQREFLRMTPSSFRVDDDGTIHAVLVASNYHWYSGVRPGRALRIRGSRPRRALVACPWADPVILPVPDAEPLLGSLRLVSKKKPPKWLLRPLARTLKPLLTPDALVTAGVIWPGEENLGDWRWSRKDAGNLEYDTALGFLAWGARDRDPRLVAWAVTASRHLVQRDLDRWPWGLPLRHGSYHRSGVVEFGHLWFEGLLAVAGTTADPFLLDEAKDLLEAFEKRCGKKVPRRTLMRCLGWGLLAATALHGWSGDEKALDRLEAYRRGFVEALGAASPLVEPMKNEPGLYRVSPWVAEGILVPALLRADELVPGPGVADRVRRMTDELIGEAWEEKTGRLYGRLVMDEKGRLVKKDGTSPGEEMLLFAAGLLAAEQLTGSTDYRRVARRVASQAWTRLRLVGKTYRGMEISQLLWWAARLP